MTRAFVGQRARRERAVMTAEPSQMQAMRAELFGFDLGTFLDAAAAAQVARVIVPGAA